jgi:hypothetical protein
MEIGELFLGFAIAPLIGRSNAAAAAVIQLSRLGIKKLNFCR